MRCIEGVAAALPWICIKTPEQARQLPSTESQSFSSCARRLHSCILNHAPELVSTDCTPRFGKSMLQVGWHCLVAFLNCKRLHGLCAWQEPFRLCVLDLQTGALVEGPSMIHSPDSPEKFSEQLSPDDQVLLLQKDPAAFYALDFPSLKVSHFARLCPCHVAGKIPTLLSHWQLLPC